MDSFKKSNKIRLKSRHRKYLFANEDECAISQSKDGKTENTLWTVEFEDDNPGMVKLKSCYDCYLTATNVPFLLGWTGKKVLQMKLIDADSSVLWEPVADGYFVKLKTRAGNFLRANGSIPPWRNSVTHDSTHKQDWFSWEVVPDGSNEAVCLSQNSSSSINTSFTSNASLTSNASFTSNVPFSQQSSFANNASFKQDAPKETPPAPTPRPRVDGRLIHYAVADDDGDIPDEFNAEIVFRGHDVKMLKDRLKEETGIKDDLHICAKQHGTKKLFPLVLQLPPHNLPMYLVVVKASSELAKTLPGVAAKTYSHSASFDDE